MKFRPLHDRVVVKRIDAEEKTTGGIIIPDTAKEKPSLQAGIENLLDFVFGFDGDPADGEQPDQTGRGDQNDEKPCP